MDTENAFKVIFDLETLVVNKSSDPPLRKLLEFLGTNIPSRLRAGTPEWEALPATEKVRSDVRFVATAAAAALGGVRKNDDGEEEGFRTSLQKVHLENGELRIGQLFKSEGTGYGLERHRASLVKYCVEALDICPCKLLRAHPNCPAPDSKAPAQSAFAVVSLDGKYYVVDCTTNLGRLEAVQVDGGSGGEPDFALPTFGDASSPRLPPFAEATPQLERQVRFGSPSTVSTNSPTPGTPGGSPSASPTLQRLASSVDRALKGQPFLAQASGQLGRPVSYVAHRRLEPERRRILETTFPELKAATLAFAVTVRLASGDESPLRRGGGAPERELLAVVPAGAAQDVDNLRPFVVMGTCRSTRKPISPCECVEYIFKEQPNHWRAATLSEEGVGHLRQVGMEVWGECLEEARSLSSGSREALSKHLTEDGPPVFNTFDASIFPTPAELKPAYEVKGTSRKALLIPHPVAALRCWNPRKQCYEALPAELSNAPVDERRQEWWDERLKLLKEEKTTVKSASKKKKRATGCC